MIGVRLALGEVVLNTLGPAELGVFAALLPDDLELDPAIPPLPLGPPPERRAQVFRQSVLRAWAGWTPSSWACPFAVRAAGVPVGVQWLESVEWSGRRAVDSSSWLVPGARGRGIGTATRRCVLAFAFGRLDARAAVSSAWADNPASLGVSYRFGYVDDFVEHRGVAGGGRTMQHVVLSASSWRRSGLSDGVLVEATDAALRLFGGQP